jgi:transcriptional regulator with PAS, ATPase and Fis domain
MQRCSREVGEAAGRYGELGNADPLGGGQARFIAGSGPMLGVVERLQKVAPVDTTVLLLGESGTGKELATSLLHEQHATRRRGPLVRVHCGAIPESLLESELFGHVRGAFTGADRDRAGLFERADGGTLLLDEISTMSPAAQVRLLRVLQDRQVTRVGATESRRVDVRVVVASNEDLKQAVEQGTFRLDLYYRVSVFPVVLPPLRERPADVAPLVEELGRRIARGMGLDRPKQLSPEAMTALVAHSWPGNVRELENALEHAYILAGDRPELSSEHLPEEIAALPPSPNLTMGGVLLTEDGLSFRTAVTNLERELILQSLRLAEGNKARAAELLRLKRTTFLEKLRRLEQDGLLTHAPQPERSSNLVEGELAV